MKYALVIFEIPKSTDITVDLALKEAADRAKRTTAKSAGVEILNKGCYLCDLRSGLHDVNSIVEAASAYGLETRTLFFEKDPAFVITKPS